MKKILILIFAFTSLYAQAEYNHKTDNRGYFYLNIGVEYVPMDNLKYTGVPLDFKYGGHVTQQSFVEAGVIFRGNISNRDSDSPFVGPSVGYKYEFYNNTQWIPGLDFTLMIGPNLSSVTKESEEITSYSVIVGFELGVYMKTFVSRSHAITLRMGATHFGKFWNNIDQLKVSTSVGIQWFI